MKFLFIFLFTASIVSCRNGVRGSGNIITEIRKIDEVNSINVSGPIKMDINYSATASLIVESDDNIMRSVVTSISDKTLSVKLKGINNVRNAVIKVHIGIPSILSISTSASAEVFNSEIFKNPNKISFSASSGSEIRFNVDAPELFAEASSGSDIELSGRTKNVIVEASSGSKGNLFSLQAENVTASASSGADIFIYASVSLKASASSGGNISYTGGAPSVVKEANSGGAVNPK